MSQLPDEIVAALRARKLLIVWASAPLALSEREPTNRAAAINQLSDQAKNLPSITTLLIEWPQMVMLSFDPTARVEQAFKAAGVALHFIRTRQDVIAQNQHVLIKLAGDLASRTGVVLSREAVRDLLSNADKRYLLDEARRIVQGGVVIIATDLSGFEKPDRPNTDLQTWWRVIQPALRAASVFAIGNAFADVPRLAVDLATVVDELRQVIMTEEPASQSISSRSGGVSIDGDQTHVGGDVTGRDKIVSAGGHIIHAEAGATVIIGDKPAALPGAQPAAGLDTSELESLRRQLAEARTNLRLIEERKAEFVMGTDVPLQLIKEERRLRDRIAELEQQLGQGGTSEGDRQP